MEVDCINLDTSQAKLSIAYEICTDGRLENINVNGRAVRADSILGTYAEIAMRPPGNFPDADLVTLSILQMEERKAAVAALRAALPNCLNPPSGGSLVGGLFPLPIQWALVHRNQPDFLTVEAVDDFLEEYIKTKPPRLSSLLGGAVCSCLFVGRQQHHFLWSSFEPKPINISTRKFSEICGHVDKIRQVFSIDIGEIRYVFNGKFVFLSIWPFLPAKFPYDLYPSVLDDLASRIASFE